MLHLTYIYLNRTRRLHLAMLIILMMCLTYSRAVTMCNLQERRPRSGGGGRGRPGYVNL